MIGTVRHGPPGPATTTHVRCVKVFWQRLPPKVPKDLRFLSKILWLDEGGDAQSSFTAGELVQLGLSQWSGTLQRRRWMDSAEVSLSKILNCWR